MVMTLRRHNPPHLGLAIVWYLWLMISTNRFVIFLRDEYEWRGAWEEGPDLFCFHFVWGSNLRSVSDVGSLSCSADMVGGWSVVPSLCRLRSKWDSHSSEISCNPFCSSFTTHVICVHQSYWGLLGFIWSCSAHSTTFLLYGSSFPQTQWEFVNHNKKNSQMNDWECFHTWNSGPRFCLSLQWSG